ncbi:caspase-7-like [Mya arenaria]|uniref:caspase-7-like n=1 Tax=Mya arenaria TaxID=6604 RepID=UPI0022E205B5|nr:caspase-7-like [Mya arenaria]
MDQSHRDILKKNRTFIIDSIANPIEVAERLFEQEIFSEGMRQEIEAQKTPNDKVRKIINTLPKRGPRAFGIFLEVLHATDNTDLAARLSGSGMGDGHSRGVAIPQEDVALPTEWPSEAHMTAAIEVKPCNVYGDQVRTQWRNPNVYNMKKRIRGRCFIISNMFFAMELDEKGVARSKLATRYGTEKDVDDLKKLFQQLHFQVDVKTDLKRDEMSTALFQESSKMSLRDMECYVCVICSHGTREGIYGTDGGVITLEEVTSYFDGQHCPYLMQKPKLFFIQACQGDQVDRTSDQTRDLGLDLSTLSRQFKKSVSLKNGCQPDAGPKPPRPQVVVEPTDRTDAVMGNTEERCVPSKQDMLVACATHPDFVSFRNEHFGSWFIQAVIYVFQKFAATESILDLLTLVNRLVAIGRTSTDRGHLAPRDATQCARFESSLTKKLLFFPGVVDDS